MPSPSRSPSVEELMQHEPTCPVNFAHLKKHGAICECGRNARIRAALERLTRDNAALAIEVKRREFEAMDNAVEAAERSKERDAARREAESLRDHIKQSCNEIRGAMPHVACFCREAPFPWETPVSVPEGGKKS